MSSYVTAPAGLFSAFVTRDDVLKELEPSQIQTAQLDAWIMREANLSPVVAFYVWNGGGSDQLMPVHVYHYSAGWRPPDVSGFAYQAVGYGRKGARAELAEVIRGFYPDPQDRAL